MMILKQTYQEKTKLVRKRIMTVRQSLTRPSNFWVAFFYWWDFV